MHLTFDDNQPLYIQIYESIEDSILRDIYKEEEQIPSTTEVSQTYQVNPATVGKGYNILVDEGTIYKKRGVGMFVSTGAKERLIKKRKKTFYENYVEKLLIEAKALGISESELVEMMKGDDDHGKN